LIEIEHGWSAPTQYRLYGRTAGYPSDSLASCLNGSCPRFEFQIWPPKWAPNFAVFETTRPKRWKFGVSRCRYERSHKPI